MKTDNKPWILPLRTYDNVKSRFERKVADAIGIPRWNLYLTIGEYRELAWRDDPTVVRKVLSVLKKDRARGKFDGIHAEIANDNHSLLKVFRLLLDAHHRSQFPSA